jgi:hypothetical protein
MHENLDLLQMSGTKDGDDQYPAEQYCPKPVDPSLTATLLAQAFIIRHLSLSYSVILFSSSFLRIEGQVWH